MTEILRDHWMSRTSEAILDGGKAWLVYGTGRALQSFPAATCSPLTGTLQFFRGRYRAMAWPGISFGCIQIYKELLEQHRRRTVGAPVIQPLIGIISGALVTGASLLLLKPGTPPRLVSFCFASAVAMDAGGRLLDSSYGAHQNDDTAEKHLRFWVACAAIGAAVTCFVAAMGQRSRLNTLFFHIAWAFATSGNLTSDLLTNHDRDRVYHLFRVVDRQRPFPLPSSCDTKVLPTAKNIIADHNYGPIGYYERGEYKGGDYESPVVLYTPYYGHMLANLVRQVYEKMREKGFIREMERFVLMEHGGWDGKLARDILEYTHRRAKEDKSWAQFNAVLEYHGVEISPVGHILQGKLEREFPGTFHAIQGDAITYRPPYPFKGVVLSTLMIDSFPLHQIGMEDGKMRAVLSTPLLVFTDTGAKEEFLHRFFGAAAGRTNQEAQQIADTCFPGRFLAGDPTTLFLSRDRFRQLQTEIARLRGDNAVAYQAALWQINYGMALVRGTVPEEQNEEVHSYLERHPHYRDALPTAGSFHINTDMDRYAENVQRYLRLGALIAVDLMSTRGEELNMLVARQGEKARMLESIGGSDFGQSLVYLGVDHYALVELFPAAQYQFHQGFLWNFYEGDREAAALELAHRLRRHVVPHRRDRVPDHLLLDRARILDGDNNYYVFVACVGEEWNQEECFARLPGPYRWREEKKP